VTRVCDALAVHDAKVNDTCGLHVHLDARKRDRELMFSNLVRSISVLYSMVPETRYRSTFCKPNTEDRLSRCGGSDRYWGINPCSYDKHKTIEVRLHSGTVNSVKINHWIDLLSAIAYDKKSLVKSNTLADFFGQVKVPTKLVEYVRARVEKFAAKRITKLLDPDNVLAPGQDSIAA
jgi:hypothetical protein